MKTDDLRNVSTIYGYDPQGIADHLKVFAAYLKVPKKEWNKYHAPYKDNFNCTPPKSVEVCVIDPILPEPYIEKVPFPAKVKEHFILTSVVNKSKKKDVEPEEQMSIEPAVAIVEDLVTKNVDDEYIIFCEDSSNIVSQPNKPRRASIPVLSVKIGDHCYYGLCDIGASYNAILYELYKEIKQEIGPCELEDIDVAIQIANRETIFPIV